jgi:prolipoprotein diacylglyceryltransferase
VLTGQAPAEAVASLPAHPTSLYEAAGAAGLGVLLLALGPRRPFRGAVALSGLVAFSVLRFVVDGLRADPERGFIGPEISTRVLTFAMAVLVAGFVWRLTSVGVQSKRRATVAVVLAFAVGVALYLVVNPLGSTGGSAVPSVNRWSSLACLAVAAAAPVFARSRPFTPEAPPS